MIAPIACTVAVVSLSLDHVCAVAVVFIAILFLACVIAIEEGRIRERAKLIQQARNNGVDPFWLEDEGGVE